MIPPEIGLHAPHAGVALLSSISHWRHAGLTARTQSTTLTLGIGLADLAPQIGWLTKQPGNVMHALSFARVAIEMIHPIELNVQDAIVLLMWLMKMLNFAVLIADHKRPITLRLNLAESVHCISHILTILKNAKIVHLDALTATVLSPERCHSA